MHYLNGLMERLFDSISGLLTLPKFSIGVTDIVEILLISVLFYNILVWIKNTRAWNLFKGLVVLLCFVMLAVVFQMNTILWLAQNTLNIALIAVIIIFQPELRRALASLGDQNFLNKFFDFSKPEVTNFSDRTIEELVKCSFTMGRAKTGALIVIENENKLEEYIRTGIDVDGIVSSPLLINIFEKNTPLHDGAVIIRGDRVASATCYLPLSDNGLLSKDLGTRHRAAVGLSEITDSLTIIVSEETGGVSAAYKGEIIRNMKAEQLREMLRQLQTKQQEESGLEKLKRRFRHAAKNQKSTDV